jgi:hypothetical protein
MASLEVSSYEEAVEKLQEVKEQLSEKREAFKAFLIENKLKKAEDHSNHSNRTLAKQFKTFKKELTDLDNQREALREFVKTSKPKKERESKYEYPSDCETALDKKKFRTTCRSRAKQAGVTLDEYLGDPEKYNQQIASKKSTPKPEKKEKSEKASPAPKAGEKVVPKIKIKVKAKSED